MIPKAKGSTRNLSGFKPVLLNENQKSFIVDPKVFIVWSLCNGRNTLEDIEVKFTNKLGLDRGEDHGVDIPAVINSLTRIGLIERATAMMVEN